MSDVTLKHSSSRTFRCIFYKALGHTACLKGPPSLHRERLLSCAAAAESHILKWYRNPVQIVSETRAAKAAKILWLPPPPPPPPPPPSRPASRLIDLTSTRHIQDMTAGGSALAALPRVLKRMRWVLCRGRAL